MLPKVRRFAREHAERPARLRAAMSSALRSVRRGGTLSPFLGRGGAVPANLQIDGQHERRALRGAARALSASRLKPRRASGTSASRTGADRRAQSSIEQIDMVLSVNGMPKSCAARAPDLAVAVEQSGQSGRRDRQRHRDRLAEHRAGDRQLREVAHHALPKLMRSRSLRLRAQRQLIVGAAIGIFEDRARDPAGARARAGLRCC